MQKKYIKYITIIDVCEQYKQHTDEDAGISSIM